MPKKVDFIQVPPGTVPKMMTVFGCSKATVYKALNLDSSTELGERIRAAALGEYGGVMSRKTKFV